MEILKSYDPVILQLNDEDIRTMHLALYDYKEGLKRNKSLRKSNRKLHIRNASKMIVLIDLLL